MANVKNRLISGVIWDSIGHFSALGFQFLVLIIISRVLAPSDYGVIGLLTVFVSVAGIILDSGFSQALIRRETLDQITLSSIFYVNLGVGVVIYSVLWFVAPYIARFYDVAELVGYARILFLIIPVSSLGLTQSVQIQKNLKFKKFAVASFGAAFISGCVGLWMAYSGCGVWALVGQQLSLAGAKTILFFIQNRWLPSFVFDFAVVRELLGFSMNLMLHSLINTLMKNLYILTIGKFYSTTEVGYYNQANKFEVISASTITSIITRVSFPVMVRLKDNREQFRSAYRGIMSMTCFVMAPVMSFLLIQAEPIFSLFLTDKWLPAAPYFQLLCIYGLIHPIIMLSYNVYKMQGRAKTLLYLDLFRHLLLVVSIVITIQRGITTLLIGQIVVMGVMAVVNMWQVGRLTTLSVWGQVTSVVPYYLVSALVAIVVCCVPSFECLALSLLSKLMLFVTIYIMIVATLRLDSYREVVTLIKSKILR
ncbi:MAG: lipopolysaccharide biosynthesis protein [Rikenellaceae bacterium]